MLHQYFFPVTRGFCLSCRSCSLFAKRLQTVGNVATEGNIATERI